MRDKPVNRQDTRRSSTTVEKARVYREAKGITTCTGPGVRPVACGERVRVLDLRSLYLRMASRCGKPGASGIKPARPGDGCREVGAALKC